MAVPVFQNPFAYDIAVPSYNGSSVIVPPKKFVQGSYYQESVDTGILVEWTGATPSSVDIVYIYPEQQGYYPGVPTTIQNVIAGSGLAGGGSAGDVTLAIAASGVVNSMIAANAVTAPKIASGQVVKSFNGLFDSVTLAVGANLTLTPVGNTLTIDAPTIGFTDVTSTAPLVLEINAGTLEGSIAITPTDNGGAVALQSSVSPEFQTGYIALDGEVLLGPASFIGINSTTNKLIPADTPAYIFIKNDNDDHLFFRFINDGAVDVASLDETGNLIVQSIDVPLVTIGANSIVLSNTPSFNVDTTFAEDIILTKQLRSTVGIEPSLNLTSSSTSIPSIKLNGGYNSDLLEVRDLFNNLNLQIKGDGSLFAKSAAFDSLSFNAELVTVGAYDLSLISEKMFACDCSGGAITFQLPLIVPGTTAPGTMYIFTKTDVSANNVLIAPQVGQTINGQASIVITDEWTPLRVAPIIGPGPTYTTFWMAV